MEIKLSRTSLTRKRNTPPKMVESTFMELRMAMKLMELPHPHFVCGIRNQSDLIMETVDKLLL